MTAAIRIDGHLTNNKTVLNYVQNVTLVSIE